MQLQLRCVFVTWALTAFVAIYRDCVTEGGGGAKFARGESTTAYEVCGKWSLLSLYVIEFHAIDTCVYVFVFVNLAARQHLALFSLFKNLWCEIKMRNCIGT
jgi:hypothetical protein